MIVNSIGTMIFSVVALMFANPWLGSPLSTGQIFLAAAGFTGVLALIHLLVNVLRDREDPEANVMGGFYSLIGYVMSLAFAVVLIGAGLWIRNDQVPYADGVTQTAILMENDQGRRYTTATYQFVTQDGRQVAFDDPIGSSDQPPVGSTATVSYRPADPESARIIRGWHGFSGFPIALIAGGLLVPAPTIGGLVRRRKRARSRSLGRG